MQISHDKKADAAYITLKQAPIAKTIPIKEGIMFDLDQNNKIIGIEFLDISKSSAEVKSLLADQASNI